ncbi:MAG TPA: serine/threonine-protein kinase, partial [Rhodothermales bacterium]
MDWQWVQDLFHEIRELPPESRAARLDEAAAEDPALRAEVESLLAADVVSGVFDSLVHRFGSVVASPTAGEGARIGPYRLLRVIGQGGMGTVYLAERADGQFERKVALKLGRFGMLDGALVHRFLNERQILARLDHPHIAHLYDGGISESIPGLPGEARPWFAMEFVEGVPIDAYCREKDLSVDDRLRLFCDVCAAVQFAHQNLVVHRDLKPSNILVDFGGVVKLLDFGISKLMAGADEGESAQTRTEARVMTPDYASPEQVLGGRITTATDVYALGIILYELLTERRPYDVGTLTASEIARVICEQPPPRPSAVVRGDDRLRRRLSGDLDTIVLRALQKDPERRYPYAAQLLEDIRRHLDGLPVQARPDRLGYRAYKFVRRHRLGVAAAALVVLSLATGVVGIAWQARIAARERDQAQLEAAKSEEVAGFLEDLFNASDPYMPRETDRPDTLRVRDFLRRGSERIRMELRDQPAVRARMLNVAGNAYRSLGLLDDALELVHEALAIRHTPGVATERDLAESLHSLALIQSDVGAYDSARTHFDQSIAILRQQPEAPDRTLAATLVDYGILLREMEEMPAAEAALREALAIQKRIVGREHLDVANTLSALGSMFVLLAQPDSAARYIDEALQIRRRLLGESHPLVSGSLLASGILYRDRGELDRADPLLREALRIRQTTLGERHLETATALYELAFLLREQRRFDEAIDAFNSVLG